MGPGFESPMVHHTKQIRTYFFSKVRSDLFFIFRLWKHKMSTILGITVDKIGKNIIMVSYDTIVSAVII